MLFSPDLKFNELPEGAKTDLQLATMFGNFYRDAEEYHSLFQANLKTAFNMYEGDQWEKEIKDKLKEQGKPALTKNFIFPLINLVQGIQNDNRLEIRTLPRTEGDSPYTEAMNGCLKWIWDKQKGDRKLSRSFFNGNVCGRGWIGVEQIEDPNVFFATKTILTVIDPSEIIYDRKSKEYDLSDCDYLIRQRMMSKSLALLLWPDKKEDLLSYYAHLDSLTNEGKISPQLKKDILVLECWYRVWEMRRFLRQEDGTIIDVTEGRKTPEGGSSPVPLTPQPEVEGSFKKCVQRMKYLRMCGSAQWGVLLEKGYSPYIDNLFPYAPYFAYRGRNLDFGIVYNLLDSQREINKRDSQMLHYINEMPKTKIITDDPDLGDKFEQGQDVIVANKGAQWTVVPFAQLPAALAQMSIGNKDDMKKISGIFDDLRGIKQGQDSGIVVDIRRQQSLNNINMLFDNLQYTSELIAELIISRIQQFMPVKQIERIIGEEKATLEVLIGIKSKMVSDYDIVISQSPSSPTLRTENFIKIMKLNQAYPNLIPPDIIVEASDIPQKDEILARLKEQANIAQEQQNIIPGAGS